jgi:hypothetical protein
VAFAPPDTWPFGRASRVRSGARQAIREAFGEDALESLRAMKRNDGITEDADLILVIDESLIAGLSAARHD